MKNTTFQLLPFKIHEHLFLCQRGVVNIGKCDLCTNLFVVNCEEISLIEYATHLYSYNCSSYDAFSLFEQVQTSDVWLNIYYKTGDFINVDQNKDNYGDIFFDLINNPFSLF